MGYKLLAASHKNGQKEYARLGPRDKSRASPREKQKSQNDGFLGRGLRRGLARVNRSRDPIWYFFLLGLRQAILTVP